MENSAAAEDPSLEVLTRLADALDTDLADLRLRAPQGPGPVWLDQGGVQTLGREECLRLLRDQPIGRVGFRTPEGVSILPVTFVMLGDRVVFRTAADTEIARCARGSVAFQVDSTDAERRVGWSVQLAGQITAVEGERLAHLRRNPPVEPWADAERRDLYLLITPDRITGRRLAGS